MKNVFRDPIAVTMALCLTGCAITSPHLMPVVPVAGTYNEVSSSDAAVVSPTWWESFGSTELSSLVAEAREPGRGAGARRWSLAVPRAERRIGYLEPPHERERWQGRDQQRHECDADRQLRDRPLGEESRGRQVREVVGVGQRVRS